MYILYNWKTSTEVKHVLRDYKRRHFPFSLKGFVSGGLISGSSGSFSVTNWINLEGGCISVESHSWLSVETCSPIFTLLYTHTHTTRAASLPNTIYTSPSYARTHIYTHTRAYTRKQHPRDSSLYTRYRLREQSISIETVYKLS